MTFMDSIDLSWTLGRMIGIAVVGYLIAIALGAAWNWLFKDSVRRTARTAGRAASKLSSTAREAADAFNEGRRQ